MSLRAGFGKLREKIEGPFSVGCLNGNFGHSRDGKHLRNGHSNGSARCLDGLLHLAEADVLVQPHGQILIVAELPKTRSGKIMRRLLRDVAEQRDVGDATTLADPAVMALIAAGLASNSSED